MGLVATFVETGAIIGIDLIALLLLLAVAP